MASIMEMGGDKANRARAKVRNGETSLTILKGAPMVYAMSGTRDGLDVLSVESVAVAKHNLFAGLAMQEILIGQIKESQTHGVCDYARVVTNSRAASSDVWAGGAAGVVGDALNINSGAAVQALSRAGVGSVNSLSPFVLAAAYASAPTSASSLGGTSLFSISNMKVFIRTL